MNIRRLRNKLRKVIKGNDIDWITKTLAISSTTDFISILDADVVLNVDKADGDNYIKPEVIDRVVDNIAVQTQVGNRVIVTCNDGMVKSTIIVIAYLIKYGNLSLSSAANKVRVKRDFKLSKINVKNIVQYRDYLYDLAINYNKNAVMPYCV